MTTPPCKTLRVHMSCLADGGRGHQERRREREQDSDGLRVHALRLCADDDGDGGLLHVHELAERAVQR